MIKTFMRNFQKICALGARIEIFFYSLLWLMVLLVMGTIAQRYVGIYEAQKMYFSCFIAWLGPVPTPGGYLVMGAIFINMASKLFFFSPWNTKQAGNIITHMGALLLLFGGFLTAAFSYEGHMIIPEGQSSAFIADYHDRALIITDAERSITLPYKNMTEGTEIDIAPPVTIIKRCRNCALTEDNKLFPLPEEKEDEINQSAIEFSIAKKNYFVSEISSVPTIITTDKGFLEISLRRARHPLPFAIELVDFKKELYPGTNTVKSYSSQVKLTDGDMTWQSVISMNQPLRYKGYTFYQSSFSQRNGIETTVLAVVKNIGRMFPYIASIVMCLGLLVHLVIQMPRLFKAKRDIAI